MNWTEITTKEEKRKLKDSESSEIVNIRQSSLKVKGENTQRRISESILVFFLLFEKLHDLVFASAVFSNTLIGGKNELCECYGSDLPG